MLSFYVFFFLILTAQYYSSFKNGDDCHNVDVANQSTKPDGNESFSANNNATMMGDTGDHAEEYYDEEWLDDEDDSLSFFANMFE